MTSDEPQNSLRLLGINISLWAFWSRTGVKRHRHLPWRFGCADKSSHNHKHKPTLSLVDFSRSSSSVLIAIACFSSFTFFGYIHWCFVVCFCGNQRHLAASVYLTDADWLRKLLSAWKCSSGAIFFLINKSKYLCRISLGQRWFWCSLNIQVGLGSALLSQLVGDFTMTLLILICSSWSHSPTVGNIPSSKVMFNKSRRKERGTLRWNGSPIGVGPRVFCFFSECLLPNRLGLPSRECRERHGGEVDLSGFSCRFRSQTLRLSHFELACPPSLCQGPLFGLTVQKQAPRAPWEI